MTVLVVAVEYRGPDLGVRTSQQRVGVREHAWDVDTATLSHGAAAGGWPAPARLPRCLPFALAVTRQVGELVTGLFGQVLDGLGGLTAWLDDVTACGVDPDTVDQSFFD